MEFNVNSPILFLLAGLVIVFVLAQSVFFLVRAVRRAREIGISKETVRHTIGSAAIFTVAPAIGIFIGVITLSKKLGLPLPWLRLSVIGSLTYELTAAETAAQSVGTSISQSSVNLTASQYATISFIMTFGIIIGIILVPVLCKKIQSGMVHIRKKDTKWSEILSTSMFMGMISAFLGLIVCDLGFVKTDAGTVFNIGLTHWIPVIIMLISALLMVLCAVLMKALRWKWLNDYALPISMIASMALAIPVTNLINSIAG